MSRANAVAIALRPVRAVAAALSLTLAALPAPAQAQRAAPAAGDGALSELERATRRMVTTENARCLTCHVGDSAHAQQGGLLFGVPSNGDGTLRQSPGFLASNHGSMACTTCNVGAFRDYPHVAARGAMPAASLDCAECHATRTPRIEAEIARSVHARRYGDSLTCTTCHDPHVMVSGARATDPRALVAQDNAACLSCHGSAAAAPRFAGQVVPAVARPDIDAIHAWLPNPGRHWAAVRCIDCHTPMVAPTALLGVSHRIVGKDEARRDCATCHTVDSALRATLYRHLHSGEASARGLQNAAIARSSYVIGATRNTTLDAGAILAVLAVLLGVLGHGFLRWVMARRRGRHGHA